ncbi:ATP-dependent endonuclease [Galactobacter valiniphilus]|uniref:ATP-dependent endonuclease n=1 Tax=Galactobacter valiniphilus TaxID=2676122 RepID=A0A399J8X9_9MICC|nr:AAA family ATPase [Galactobacter valiniphilus]RII42031.1 ATP-dependent endonuclease [Galactobacter valiniphilus]
MKISNIHIRNFRTLYDVSVEFENLTSFIGPNGAGKSTVLLALDWFFNGRPGTLSVADSTHGHAADPIEVEVSFSSLTARDRDELGKYAPIGTDTFTCWKRRNVDGSESLSANAKSFPPFAEVRSARSAVDKKSAYAKIRAERPDLDLPIATTVQAIESSMTVWEAANASLLEDSPEALQTNFFGFNSGGKMSGLFDFVLVSADLRASEEALDVKTSVIGRILERTVDRSAADAEIEAIANASRTQQQQVFEERFGPKLKQVSQDLNTALGRLAMGKHVSLRPGLVEAKPVRMPFEVEIGRAERPAGEKTQVEREGHGFQRTLLVTALQVLAASGSAGNHGTICLAIEEPELYQHPIQARAFARVLRDLAEGDSADMQVVFATHSEVFVEAERFSEVRRVDIHGSNEYTGILSASQTRVRRRVQGFVEDMRFDAQFAGLLTNTLSEALFSERVLLVEGSTDREVLYGIGDRTTVGRYEAAGLSIVPVGGKGNLIFAHAILSELGIPVFTLFDGDVGSEARGRSKSLSEKQISSTRANNATQNRNVLAYFGMTEQDFPEFEIGSEVAVLPDRIESTLEELWPGWDAKKTDLEMATGLEAAKNSRLYRLATQQAAGPVPDQLLEILDHALGVCHRSGCEGVK